MNMVACVYLKALTFAYPLPELLLPAQRQVSALLDFDPLQQLGDRALGRECFELLPAR